MDWVAPPPWNTQCTKFNLKIDESTELLDTKTFDDYDTNELLLLSDTIKQSCFEISIQFSY